MAEGLQRAVNAASASQGKPAAVLHLAQFDEVTERYVTGCGRQMSKVMHGTWDAAKVTCKRCLKALPAPECRTCGNTGRVWTADHDGTPCDQACPDCETPYPVSKGGE